jgi:hypothetical protein
VISGASVPLIFGGLAARVEKTILPILHKQKGFEDAISFVSPERSEAMAMSFWDKREDAAFYNHMAYLDVLRVL